MSLNKAVLVGLIAMPIALETRADCTFAPTPGNDTYLCDSGTSSSGLTDLGGDNSLTLPAGGSGILAGNVNFGPGVDRVEIASGQITGTVNQGAGIDDFVMHGGQIQALAQGDGRDTFLMTGGTISGAFEDGDVAVMTGGTIGRVDMKLDDNLFDLSGGQIIGNLVAGFGRDQIRLSGGRIGGNISVSGGDDLVEISGGEVGGNLLLSFGDDRFIWRDAGVIRGQVLMAAGNDSALLSGLAEATLASTPLLDGGLGTDSLLFADSQAAGAGRFINWESIALSRTSRLYLDDDLVLGDADSLSGSLDIDASSTLAASNASVRANQAGQNVVVRNSGTLDLTSSGASSADRLTLVGDYQGNGARLKLQSALGSDDSPSDRLVIAQGAATGTTALYVSNVGGTGGLTEGDGIRVVETTAGGSTASTAFSLGQRVAAGAYEYYLFRGAPSDSASQDWYLRSSVIESPASTPAAGTPALPQAQPGRAIPLYRPEAPLYAAAASGAHWLSQATLATYHQRRGSQEVGEGSWGRVLGERRQQQWDGELSPALDGHVTGFQVGHDLFAQRDSAYPQRAGVFIAHGTLRGDAKGFALGFEGTRVGSLELDANSLGAYWTMTNPSAGYLDAVLMGSRLSGHTRSDAGLGMNLRGHAWSASLEAGQPLQWAEQLWFEPQAQLVAEKIQWRGARDSVSAVQLHNDLSLTARVGARVFSRQQVGTQYLEPSLRANLWQGLRGGDRVTFGGRDAMHTDHQGAVGELGIGLLARPAPATQVHLNLDYRRHLDAQRGSGLQANLGLQVQW
ncbi:autotransporter domain-containing protein [Pseudomonas sp. nanlin1]|uniref:autotransporter family protein n=1 Tax=Pseudomonas sp. nanlin1 TaxID=3040605 RepID=UPI003890948A